MIVVDDQTRLVSLSRNIHSRDLSPIASFVSCPFRERYLLVRVWPDSSTNPSAADLHGTGDCHRRRHCTCWHGLGDRLAIDDIVVVKNETRLVLYTMVSRHTVSRPVPLS